MRERGRCVFEDATGEKEAVNQNQTGPYQPLKNKRNKDRNRENCYGRVASAVHKQRYRALVVVRIGIVVNPFVKLGRNRHCHHDEQLDDQQRGDPPSQRETSMSENSIHIANRLANTSQGKALHLALKLRPQNEAVLREVEHAGRIAAI